MGVAQANAQQARFLLPAEKNIFILDISGSTNSSVLWKNSLRPSIVKRLNQPFGFPDVKGFKAKAPLDVSVSLINEQSVDAPVFQIVSFEDAKRIWGLIYNIGGGNPTSARLKQITGELFGEGQTYSKEAEFLNKSTVALPSLRQCTASINQSFKTLSYMGDLEITKKNEAAKGLCETIIKIGRNLKAADNYFVEAKCHASKCSDIPGAILRTTYAAADASQLRPKPRICIAIASDMLSDYPGMSTASILNSREIALQAPSNEIAQQKGAEAAQAAGIKFPKGMDVRVSIIGQGSGPRPLPLERNSMLTSYWRGFWESAGIVSSNQVRSLDQACSY